MGETVSSNYKEITLKLDAGFVGSQLIPPSQSVQSITVVAVTDNTVTGSLSLGDGTSNPGKQIPLALGVRIECCPPERDGVFFDALAQAGKTITLHFGFSGGPATVNRGAT